MMHQRLQRVVPGISLIVTSKDGPALAGENRNRAVASATGEYVVFVDADDAMHPRRLEVLAHVFTSYHPQVILNGYSPGIPRSKYVEPLDNPFEIVSVENMYSPRNTEDLWRKSSRVHQGQPAAERALFAAVPQEEHLQRGQDVNWP